MPANTSKTPRIVVGVDGSPSSVIALRWAIKQADLNGSAVEAVTAWQIPAAMTGYGWAPVPVADCSDMELIAKRALEEAIAEAAGPGGIPLVHGEIVQGLPAQVLIDASVGADLLVVGSRGHGGFAGALLGSVSQHCVHHAHCPILIIRGDEAQKGAD
jgi:nucleotide-binding universal stress UspA family protein